MCVHLRNVMHAMFWLQDDMIPEDPSVGANFCIFLFEDVEELERIMHCVVVDNEFWEHMVTKTHPTEWTYI